MASSVHTSATNTLSFDAIDMVLLLLPLHVVVLLSLVCGSSLSVGMAAIVQAEAPLRQG